MGYYVDNDGNYYDGDCRNADDKAVQQRPTPEHCYRGGKWKIDRDKATAAKFDEIEAELTRRRESGGFNVDGVWFSSAAADRSNQTICGLLGSNLPAGVKWKTLAGDKVAVTAELVKKLLQATVTLDSALQNVADSHRAAIAKASDGEIADYNCTVNWPPMYGE